ncbi:hypothetical protein [uncultured Zobellia sp.]|uniref:hypothetical protein n=1 Tax=uncultured Zobellia sp. TaxID=255433 RepID=UPI0025925EFD|nr:hypothetical protein [uncultured Zobellia sp.]
MDVATPFVFQVDSAIVGEVYRKRANYKIVIDDSVRDKSTCAIYFSSNDIYFPNKEEVFQKRIVEKDAFEWYGTRINGAYKHIFVRDVFKQWYLKGINQELNSIEKVAAFLKNETKECDVVTLGSSSGGFAAVLFGSLLGAKKVLSFNGQYEVKSLLKTSKETTDPILFRNKETVLVSYYDIKSFINSEVDIFYFYSNASNWDVTQWEHIKEVPNIHTIEFKTNHHGIPFVKEALSKVINLDKNQLKTLVDRKHHPVLFSVHMIGLRKVLIGIYAQLRNKYRRQSN